MLNKARKMNSVTLVLLNYNGYDYTEKCLKSLAETAFRNFKLILVDNGSTDDSLQKIKALLRTKKFNFEIKLVLSSWNRGFPGGMNFGYKFAKGEIVVLLNNDLIFKKNWLTEILKVFESRNDAGVVGPKIYNKYDGKKFDFFGYGTTSLVEFSAFFGVPENAKQPVNIFSISGACLAFRRQDVKMPFDEDYFFYHEDTYFSWKMRLKGHQNFIAPSSVVYHLGSPTVKKISLPFSKFGERNRIMNMILFYEFVSLIRVLPLMLISVLLVNLWDVRNAKNRIVAYLWILTHIIPILKKRGAIQKLRHVPDSEIISHMSCKFGEPKLAVGLQKIGLYALNFISVIYCYIVRLRTVEFSNKK